MSHPKDSAAATSNDSHEPVIGSEKLSPEMNAALHAAREEEQNEQAANAPKRDTAKPSVADTVAQMQEALAEALDAGESENDASHVQEELAAMKDQLMRTMAEMENLRKRTEREASDARKYAVTGFARDMVNVVENLQLAIQNITEDDKKNDERLSNIAQGVEMTYKELLRIFQSNGIVRIDPKGEKFNHNHHQAVAHVEDATAEPGSVAQVLQAGYIIHDRLLRPAMVTVAKSGDKSESITTQA